MQNRTMRNLSVSAATAALWKYPPWVANRPEFFGTVPNSDAVSRVPNGSVRGRLMSRIFTEQKSNMNSDPYFRFFAFDLCL